MKTLWGMVCAVGAAAFLFSLPAHPLEAGAAKVELVPADGVPLDGDFSRRGRPATGSRDPLYVRALFLQDDNAACFLVSADLFAISPDLRARVLEMAPAGAPRENIVLVATHTLNGPGGLDRSWLGRQRGGRFMSEHVEAVAGKFAEAMQLAYDGRKRAAAGYATADTNYIVNRFDPAAPVDGKLSVLRVDDSDGNPIAILANLGVAPQGARSMAYSADFPGTFCTVLEGMMALPAVAFFLNGGSVDQIPAPLEGGQPFAEVVATQAKGLVNQISCREVALSFASQTLEAPQHSATPSYSRDVVLQALEIDRLAMIFMPVMPRGAVASAMRKAIADKGYANNMVVAPANGYMGALAPIESIGFSEAEGEPVYFGPSAGSWFAANAVSLFSRAEESAEFAEAASSSAHALNEANGIVHASLSGVPEDVGAERGRVLQAMELPKVADALPANWLSNAAAPVLGHWGLLKPAVSVETLARPIAGEAARGLLRGLGAQHITELAAMSDAAGEPFTDLWLRQLAPSSDEAVRVGPVGVAFMLDSNDAGSLIGQSIEWPSDVRPVVSHVRPAQGRAYAMVGLPWQVGGVAGVNDRGLAAALAPSHPASPVTLAVPADLVLADLLANASSLDEAIALLSVARPEFTGRILLVHDDGETSRTAVVDLGVMPSVALDVTTGIFAADEAALTPRELRVRGLLNGLSVPIGARAETILMDRDHRAAAEDRVLLPVTRASVVLVPRRHEIRIVAPHEGVPGTFEAVNVRGEES